MGDEWKVIHVKFVNNLEMNCSGSKNSMKKVSESFPLGSPSTSCGDTVFSWMLSPVGIPDFVSTYWEKKPLSVNRNLSEYFSGIFSRKSVENILKTDSDFAMNSLVMSRAGEVSPGCPSDVETMGEMLDDGWTVQLIHPQQKNAKLHALIERLENFTGSLWGANFYCTGTGLETCVSQCTSSNVDLFVLQFTGSSHWKVYGPEIPLSRNFGDSVDPESLGPPLLDETLSAGDMIYIPRGSMYSSSPSASSSHLCLSTYQENGWCDLLSTLTSTTLTQLTEESILFREGLPFNWSQLFGVSLVETESNKMDRESFIKKLKAHLLNLVESSISRIDSIADEMAADFIALRTPPIKRVGITFFGPDPRLVTGEIRFRNPSWIRLVQEEENELLLFSCLENNVSEHMKTDNPMDAEPTSIEIDPRELEGLQTLITNWPQWTDVACINRQLAGTLWEHCVLETRETAKKQRKLD